MFGILFPNTALQMLNSWVHSPSGYKDLNVGELKVDDSPLLSSVEESYKHALAIYEEWKGSARERQEALGKVIHQPQVQDKSSSQTERKSPVKVPFPSYVGQKLTQGLPFAVKGLKTNPEVCEWRHLLVMMEAGFNLGCALALTSSEFAENIIQEACRQGTVFNMPATNRPWEIAYSGAIKFLESRQKSLSEFLLKKKGENASKPEPTDADVLSSTIMSYTMFFPDFTTDEYNDVVVKREDCIKNIAGELVSGLVLGLKFPESALLILKGWIYKKNIFGLDAGGVFHTVEDAFKGINALYNSWSNEQ